MELNNESNCELGSSSGSRPQFGNRELNDISRVYEHNAWDDVQWTDELDAEAKEKVAKNTTNVNQETFDKFDTEAPNYWNDFYNTHQDRFFKDRHWLFTEFPELGSVIANENSTPTEVTSAESYIGELRSTRILEVGCGVGNTFIPLLEANTNPDVFVYGCDFSEIAVDILRRHSSYDPSKCHAFICDISAENWTVPFPEESLDIIILIFVLSSLNPEKFPSVIRKLVSYLKPGGLVLFRDYGRYDLAQLRFKKGACLGDNFYVRGDGTRSYFFTQDDVEVMFSGARLTKEIIHVDRRLQVNRGKKLTMYRIWIQSKYRKPVKAL